eukprot:g8608.t1
MRPLTRTEPCDFWFKRGTCKFGNQCKYSHDLTHYSIDGGHFDRFTEEGLPIRPGEKLCGVYSKTGNCPYGARCKFDHFTNFVNRTRVPLETINGRPNFRSHGHRKLGTYQDSRKLRMRNFHMEFGPQAPSAPLPFSIETSPRQHCLDQSSSSITDGSGGSNFNQLSRLLNSNRNPPWCFLESQEDNDQDLENSVHSRLSYLLQVLDQKREVYREYNTIIGLSWPAIRSQWYPPGAPNGSMKSRLDKDLDFKNTGAPTQASHLLKPLRIKEDSFCQV